MTNEKFATYCGPAVISAITFQPREVVSEYLAQSHKRQHGSKVRGGTTPSVIKEVLEQLGYSIEIVFSVAQPTNLTVYGFRLAYGDGKFIVATRDHFIALEDGMVMEDNGSGLPNARVEWAIRVTESW